MGRRILAYAFLTLGAAAFAHGQILPAVSSPPEPVVLIRRLVDTRYFDEGRRASLQGALDQDLWRTATVSSNVSSIVAEEFKFGSSNSKEAYKLIEDKIAELNGIDDMRRIPANKKIKIPDIPVMALERYNPAKPENAIPKLSEIGPKQDTLNGRTYDFLSESFTNRPQILDEGRKASTFVEQYRWVPLSQARRLLAQQTPAAPITTANWRWTLKFSSEYQVDSTNASPLSAEDLSKIKEILASPKKQNPLLIVLDDSWPSDEEFVHAKDFLLSALQTVRNTSNWKLGSPTFSTAFKKTKSTTYPKDSSDPSKSAHLHSRDIMNSLYPLKQLEPSDGRVEVLFLPLFRAQAYADEVLTELVHFEQLVHLPGTTLAQGISRDQVKAKRKYAEGIVRSVSDKIQEDLLYSDQSIVEAVVWFGAFYSTVSKRPVFFSFSWITKENDLHIELPQRYYGAFFAAAGNEPAIDWPPESDRCNPYSAHTAYDLGRQLVIRSKWPGDVIGVMNVAEDGSPDCYSSLLKVDSNVSALAYPGRVTGDVCGTSFATPRVAWFAAAREALRTPPTNYDDWRCTFRDEIRAIRSPDACAFNKIRFDPVKFLADYNR